MYDNPITFLRESSVLSKSAAALTVFFFLFSFYSPAALAVKEAVEAEQAKNQFHAQGKTDDEKLSYTLQSIKEHVAERRAKLRQRVEAESTLWQDLLNFFGLSELTAEDLDKLESMAEQAEQLHQKALASFDKTEQQLKEKGLPETILERHRQTVEKYKAEHQRFQTTLRQLRAAESLQDQAEVMEELDAFFEEQQFKRSQQPFDPDKLPFGTPDPKKIRKPATDKQQLNELLGFNKSPSAGEQLLDAVVSPAYAQTTNEPTPADLEETIDVQITEAIQARADELNNDPVEIYNWVRNNIEFLPTYGSIQGSDMTLQTLKGNPFDTASLLIALLRASDIPARYAYGTVRIPVDKVMNWVGGVEVPEAAMSILGQGGIPNTGITQGGRITHIRMEHIWVEAWVDYFPSRGAKNIQGDTWIPLDGSFKQYDYTDGVDIQDQVPFDAQGFADTIVADATIDETTGTVQGVDQQYIQDQISQYQEQSEQFLASQHPDATVGEVIGTKTVRQESRPALASGLPYNRLATSERFTAVPDNLRHKYRFQLKSQYGSTLFSQALDLPSIADSTIALSFNPATETDEQTLQSLIPENITDISQLPESIPGYLVNLEAQLVIDQQEQVSGAMFTMGDEVTLNQALYNPRDGWGSTDTTIVAGEYHAIAITGAGVGADKLQRLQSEAQSAQAVLEACRANNDCSSIQETSRRQFVNTILQAGVLGWFSITQTQDYLAAFSQDVVYHPLPSYGKFGVSAQVQYNWGIPRNISFPGMLMDIDFSQILVEPVNGDAEERVDFVQMSGTRGSANEHLVPEQLLSTQDNPVEGISAVKAISIASSNGQRVYVLSQENIDQLSSITIDSSSRDEIRNAINAGKQVTVHEQPIDQFGWRGSGYIIADPDTGSAAYKITGGANGGQILLFLSFLLITIYLVVAISAFIAGLLIFPLTAAAILLTTFGIISSINDLKRAWDECTGIGFIAIALAIIVKNTLAAMVSRLEGILLSIIDIALPKPEELGPACR